MSNGSRQDLLNQDKTRIFSSQNSQDKTKSRKGWQNQDKTRFLSFQISRQDKTRKPFLVKNKSRLQDKKFLDPSLVDSISSEQEWREFSLAE